MTQTASGDESSTFYEEILDTNHNMVPRGEIPTSPHQVCQTCHTHEEYQKYVEPANETSTEIGSILEPPAQKSLPLTRALWNPSDHGSGYQNNRELLMNQEPSSNCLGCHDGVIGEDIHGRIQDNGKFLDHPNNITYPRESNGHFVSKLPLPNELRYWSIPDQDGKGITLPTGPTSQYFSVQTPPVLAVRSSGGKVQCGSCHNPHTARIAAFLRESPKTLCLVCHIR